MFQENSERGWWFTATGKSVTQTHQSEPTRQHTHSWLVNHRQRSACLWLAEQGELGRADLGCHGDVETVLPESRRPSGGDVNSSPSPLRWSSQQTSRRTSRTARRFERVAIERNFATTLSTRSNSYGRALSRTSCYLTRLSSESLACASFTTLRRSWLAAR